MFNLFYVPFINHIVVHIVLFSCMPKYITYIYKPVYLKHVFIYVHWFVFYKTANLYTPTLNF